MSLNRPKIRTFEMFKKTIYRAKHVLSSKIEGTPSTQSKTSISPNLGAFASLRRGSGHALRESQVFPIALFRIGS
jgi:hypothetical protein